MSPQLLTDLGAEVIPAGRSDTFVPIDTENIEEEQLQTIQTLADQAWKSHGRLDAVVSADGDSDRPLLLGIESGANDGRVQFFGGDRIGMIVAKYLGADAVVVPISCNDAVDCGALKPILEPKTRIGSPYVIAGMEKAREKGRHRVCGWEANGGFLTGSDIERNGKVLKALPTRDAVLPILSVLFSMAAQHAPMTALFERLPKRFSRAALLKNFPRSVSLKIIKRFSPSDERIKEVIFEGERVVLKDEEQQEIVAKEITASMRTVRDDLTTFFPSALGFGSITRINYIDGVRIYFSNGDVAHVRPSGNADELRMTVASLLMAGTDTTRNQLSASVQVLCDHP